MTLLDVFPEDERAAYLEKRRAGVLGACSGERAWRHLTAAGGELEIVPYVEALTIGGRPAVLAALFDVTQQRAAEVELKRVAEDLRQAKAAADAASRAKSEFLANMSHEIRTPLNGVVGMADLLAKSDLGAREQEMAEVIRASGETLQSLLTDILDLARIEAGHVKIESCPFQLGDCIRGVAALARLKAEEKGVLLSVDVRPEVDRQFLGDALRIRQILTNLISNAVKFTDAGEVSVSAQPGATGAVRLTVADTGIGFDVERKAQIFSRFEQADGSITRRFGGSGLGLSISRDLAALMGGALDCDSRPGEGSRFWVDVPLEVAPAEPAPASPDAANVQASAEAFRILIVDDHPTNRKVAELILTGAGAEAVCASDGREAVSVFKASAFDLVLMDMQMPIMDGLQAVREIRRHEAETGRSRTPVLMLSANALPEHISTSLEAGADGHIAKPVTVGRLLGAIAQATPRDNPNGATCAA
jgi:signal transduction histidine kinase/ActR/RegA family two-component response regulator